MRYFLPVNKFSPSQSRAGGKASAKSKNAAWNLAQQIKATPEAQAREAAAQAAHAEWIASLSDEALTTLNANRAKLNLPPETR